MRLGGYFFTFGAVSCPSDCREEHGWRQSFSHGFVSNKIDLTFGSVFSPHRLHRWTQMFCRVMRFFLHRFDSDELKVLSNCTDYCRRKRRWLMSKTSRMAGATEAPTICAIRKKSVWERICVHLCNLWARKVPFVVLYSLHQGSPR